MSQSIKWAHDAVLFYMNEFSSRVVAQSGLPGDRYHLGKLIFQGLKDDPDFICQINGANDESETNGSVLLRSIKCAIAFKSLGLRKGDVIILLAPNHLNLTIPLYAALYLGIIIAALDDSLGINELKDYFSVDEPKIVFCQAEKFRTVQMALNNAQIDSRIVTFDDGADCDNFKDFLKLHEDEIHKHEKAIEEFILRYKQFAKAVTKSTFNLSSLPPTQDTARCHTFRVYHQVQSWLGNNNDPEDWGWKKCGKLLMPVQSSKPPAPPEFLKLIFCKCKGNCGAMCGCRKAGLKCSAVCFHCSGELCSVSCVGGSTFCHCLGEFPADFDPEETVAMLTSTSGTTGLPKAVVLTHKNLAISVPYVWLHHSKFPTPTKIALIVSPLQWLSAGFHYLFSPILKFTRLQTTDKLTQDVFRQLVNKYRPTYTAISPMLLKSVYKMEDKKCDMTCFETILIGGGAVPQDILDDVKKINPDIKTASCYGLSEIGGLAFYDQFQKNGSVGKPMGYLDYKLVNPETMEIINEPNENGELCLRGPSVCQGYYKCPEATAEAFLKDGWLRTGDIFYRDEEWNFYFVERLKLLLKYKNHQISPLELEAVIRQHPAVLDVAVVGLDDPECGELPVAFVVPKQNHVITAQEVKDIVKDSLTDSKHLRGGVIFMKELPMTNTTKVHRRQLRDMAKVMDRE